MGMITSYCLFALAILSVTSAQNNLIDDVVHAGLKCHNNPGLAIAVVKDGQVVLSRGYGVTDVDSEASVNNETLFSIASNTKAFTTTALLKLLRKRNDLDIQTKVKQILGRRFEFSDSLRTNYATLEDLAAHRMGVPSNNFLRLDTCLTRKNLERRVKYLKAIGGFRDSFYYSNLMYGLLTDVIEKIEAKRWEDVVQDEIFNPLHMTSSTFATRFNFTGNVAIPYVLEKGVLYNASIDFIKHWALIGGSGAIVSNANDMAKWLLFHLAKGKNEDGAQVVDGKDLLETYKARNTIPLTSSINRYFQRPKLPVTTSNDGYALGWKTGYYRGLRIVQHTGSTFGYRSIATLIPSQKLGIFIVMNGADSKYFFRMTLNNYLADVYMGEKPWLNTTTICTFPKPWYSLKRSTSGSGNRKPGRPPHISPREYIGIYWNEAYGIICVNYYRQTDKIEAVYGYGKWVLTVVDDDVFDGKWTQGAPFIDVTFKFSRSRGLVNSLTIPTFEKRSPPTFHRII